MSEIAPSVLITGANGFVGARLSRYFVAEGWTVIAGVRESANLEQLKGLDVNFRYGDVCQPESLKDMVRGVDYIIHNAGIVKARKVRQFFEVNEIGTRNLFEAAVKNNPGVKKMVYISSAAAGGPSQENQPRTENMESKPVTVYGQSKLAGEKSAQSYAVRIPVLILRPMGVYGPGDKEAFTFFKSINMRVKPLLGDRNRRLQMIHVDDLCRAVYQSLVCTASTGSIYYIAEKTSYGFLDLLNLLEKASGKKAISLAVPSGLFKLIAFFSEHLSKLINQTPMLTVAKTHELLAAWEVSTEAAKRDLKFESQISFSDGAEETFDWYRKAGWL